MRLPESFLSELNARTPLPVVIGRRVKLSRSGKDFKGCCPFHGEKTPSFHVYPDGFHCFGCGAHGDAISFVMQSQGASFMEAVEQLAGEAGMEIPRPSQEAAEAERRRLDIGGVLEAAGRAYARRLRAPEGRAALDYLRRRGLTDATIEKFGLGWSGEGRGALAAELAAEGVAVPALIEAGLMRTPDAEEGRSPYDLFFNRVMFPIRDRRGRVISFGGRTLGDAQPKYVNGPETPLFSKRRSLYALDLAREGARAGAAVVVVEGYMDAIALHQAGFSGAVAPLGTALTAEQLGELWHLAPAPVLCFDGDDAGRRATLRASEIALPRLAADRTLRFIDLPTGEDPDSLLRRPGGKAQLEGRIEKARSFVDAVFEMQSGTIRPGKKATPEERAAFFIRLERSAKTIEDRALSNEYLFEFRERFFQARRIGRARNGEWGGAIQTGFPRGPLPSAEAVSAERARNLTALLVRHPELLADVDHAYAEVDLPAPYDSLRSALLECAAESVLLDSSTLITHLIRSGFEEEVANYSSAALMLPLPASFAETAMPAQAESDWWHFFGLLRGSDRLEKEVADSQRDLAANLNERTQARHIALCTALNNLRRGEQEAEADA